MLLILKKKKEKREDVLESITMDNIRLISIVIGRQIDARYIICHVVCVTCFSNIINPY